MRTNLTIGLLAALTLISACSKQNEPPQAAADIAIAGIESVEIVPGLSQRTLAQGDGAGAEAGQTVVVHYTGWLFDAEGEKFRGSKFDSSVDRGAHFEFPLGAGRVIQGWDQGVVGMQVGEVRELTIAPEMGYGERGAGDAIPPNATLVFVVELADLKDPAANIEIAGIESVEVVPGLSQRTLMRGDGAVAEVGHTAVVHYTGWLFDAEGEKFRGSKFDSSVDRGAHFEFPLGAGRVIQGWDQGVVGMQVGEVRELTIAPEMGYGERGAAGGAIPPNSTLVFVVELAGLRGLDTEAP